VIRLIVRTGIALIGNAFGLIVAAAVLDKMTLNASGFVIAVIVFTVVLALIQPFLVTQLRRGGASGGALGGVALIATFVSLLVTDLISDGISISGIGTWIAATVIVWAASVLAVFILPYLGLKKYLEERRAT
jgi:putative membrane protein